MDLGSLVQCEGLCWVYNKNWMIDDNWVKQIGGL